jgi:hypothetical protein
MHARKMHAYEIGGHVQIGRRRHGSTCWSLLVTAICLSELLAPRHPFSSEGPILTPQACPPKRASLRSRQERPRGSCVGEQKLSKLAARTPFVSFGGADWGMLRVVKDAALLANSSFPKFQPMPPMPVDNPGRGCPWMQTWFFSGHTNTKKHISLSMIHG